MGIREWSNKNPKVVAVIVGVCVVGAIGASAYSLMGNKPHNTLTAPDEYYTSDDGKTFFALPGSNTAPFTYEGKTCVSAQVFECGGNRFVGYEKKYTAKVIAMLTAGKKQGNWMLDGDEVKKPGDSKWVLLTDREAALKVMDVQCPSGNGTPEPVDP